MPRKQPVGLGIDPTDDDSEDYKQFYRFAWENIIAPGAKERTTDVLTDELELGKWPGDEQTTQRIQGARSVDDLSAITKERRGTHTQLLKARKQEAEFRAQDPNLFQRGVQAVQDFLTPDAVVPPPPVTVPSDARQTPLVVPPTPSRPPALQAPTPDQLLPAPSGLRFQVEEGEIIDTQTRQIISPDQFNRLSTAQDKAEIERQLKAGGLLEDAPDTRLYSTTIRRGDKFGNVLGHDPLTPEEEATAPFMGGKTYATEEEAAAAAANEAQADYDRQRRDPNSAWYNPALPDQPLEVPEVIVTPENAAPEQPRSLSQALTQATNNFFQGIGMVGADLLKGVALLSAELDRVLPEMLQDPRAAEERLTYKLGAGFERLAKRRFPSDPQAQKEFLIGVLPQAAGSMAAFMAGGLAGAFAKAPVAAGTAIAGTMGALVGGTDQYEDAKEHGANEETRRKAFWLGSAVGSTEALPIAGVLNRFNKATGGKFFTILKETGVTAAQEFLQEWGQQVGSNAIAQQLYDEHRGLFEGAGIGGAAGGITGGVVGFLSGLLQGRKARKQHQNQDTQNTSPFVGEPPEKPDVTAAIPGELEIAQRPPFLIKQQPLQAAPELPPAMMPTTSDPALVPDSREGGRPLELVQEPIQEPIQDLPPLPEDPIPLPTDLAPVMERPPIVPATPDAALVDQPGAVLSDRTDTVRAEAPLLPPEISQPSKTAQQINARQIAEEPASQAVEEPEVLELPDVVVKGERPTKSVALPAPTPEQALVPTSAPATPEESIMELAPIERERLAERLEEGKAKKDKPESQPQALVGEANFQVGERVSFERNGKTLTGTIKGYAGDELDVQVDQIARPGWVPLLRREIVKVTNPTLRRLDVKGVLKPEQAPTPDAPVTVDQGQQPKGYTLPTPENVVDAAAQQAATSPENALPQPTEAQKQAGNYQKGHVRIAGLDISIENPAGSTRSGKDKSGKPWSVTMKSHYGYIRGTEGKDKDHIDLFIKPGTPEDYSGTVYIVDQNQPGTKTFDEHKIVMGASSIEEAKQLYRENYAKNWTGLGAISALPMKQFKEWLASGETKKPYHRKDNPFTRRQVETPEEAGQSQSSRPRVPTPESAILSPMAPDRGPGSSESAQTPPEPGRSKRTLPWVSLKSIRQLMAQYNDLDDLGLYVRWTSDHRADLRRGYSLDHSTNKEELGLSAQRLFSDFDDETLLSRIEEYQYLGGNAVLFVGTEVGKDSDGAPVIRKAKAVAKINVSQLRQDVSKNKQSPNPSGPQAGGPTVSSPVKEGQQEIPVPPPTIGERPIIGREAQPEEAPLFSKAAQEPEAEQTTLPTPDTAVRRPGPVATPDEVVRTVAGPQRRSNPVKPKRTQSEPPISRMKVNSEGGEQRAAAGMDPRIMKVLGGNLYSGDLGKIAVKEMLQNAVDSVRGLPEGRDGQIDVDVNTDTRTIRVDDTGMGMTPDIATKELLDIGGSKKVEGSSGGVDSRRQGDSEGSREPGTGPRETVSSRSGGEAEALGTGTPVSQPRRRVTSATVLADLFRQEAEDAAKKVRPRQPRIPVAPLSGGSATGLADIILDLEQGVGRKLTVGKTGRGNAGVYKPGSTATLIRYSGDLDTTAHELAHALDDKYGLVKAYKGLQSSPFDAELEPFAQHGSVTTSGPRSTPTYARAEGVAEWIRAWVVNPDAAEAAAPNFAAHVTQQLPADVQKALQQFSKQVRQWAGNTAHAKIMANVQWETPESGLLHWLTGGRTAKGPGFQLTVGDQMATVLTDRLAPFMKALQYVRDQRGLTGEPVLPGHDPALLARLYMGVNAKLDDIFAHGMVDSQLERATPGGLAWLLEPLDRTSKDTLGRDMQEVASLMIAQRTIEKARQLGKAKVSGIGAGIESDVEVAETRLAELQANPARFAQLQEAATRYRQWADANLRYLVDKGRLSEEQYEAIKANNEQYVAMQRIIEVSPGEEIIAHIPRGTAGRKLGTVGQPVKTFEGSTRTIKNPYLSLMDATHQAVREADRNEILKLFRDLLTLDRGMYQGEPVDLASVGRAGKTGEKHTIPVYVNGQKELWQFHPDVYKALKGIEEGMYKLPPVLTALPRILRATIVNAPPFALRNVIRDAWHRSIVSLVGSKPWDTLKPYSKEEIAQLKQSGGDQAGHYYSDAKSYARALTYAMQEAVNDGTSIVVNPDKLAQWARKGGQGYLDLMQQSERRGRLSEYRRALSHAKETLGYDDYHAMLYAAGQARGLLDYAVAGNWMMLVNQMIPFSNAAVQGMRSNVLRAKADPSGFALRFGLFALVPTLLSYAWNYFYDDDLDEYRQLPAYQRDLFWNFKLGPDLWLKIPKPFENGVLASTFERTLDLSLGNSKAFDGHAGAFLRTLLPIDEASFAGPYQALFQAAANYDFFRDRPIVPRWEENLALELRTYNRASRLGQAIQRAIGVDARKIDFVIEQQFGYLGRYAVDASDTGRKDKHGLTLSSTGVLGSSPASTSIDARWVTDLAEERGLAPSKSKAVQRIKRVQDVHAGDSRNVDAARYGVFRKHLNEYYKAETSAERDRLSALIRSEATYLRTLWTKNPPKADAEEKAAEKRAKESEPDPVLGLMGLPQPTSKHPVATLPHLIP